MTSEPAIASARRAGRVAGFLAEPAWHRRRDADLFRLGRMPMEGVRTAAHVRLVLGRGLELRALLRELGASAARSRERRSG